MPSLQIQDFPSELHRLLKCDAARKHRSLNQHVIHLLYEDVGMKVTPKEKIATALDRCLSKKNTINHKTLIDPVKIIREDRSR